MLRSRVVVFALFSTLLVLIGMWFIWFSQPSVPEFDGETALQYVELQLSFGPRTLGSPAHENAVNWMVDTLRGSGWEAEIQETERLGHPVQNVIAKRGSGTPWIILGAHYDSRFVADHDPDPAMRTEPVPGANDGASGVAVLLELARALPHHLEAEVWLVFFDAEDNGNIEGWDWILGSRAFAESLAAHPDAVVVVDMVGDADLQIYLEGNSDETLRSEIWDQATALGYGDIFVSEVRHSMLDDHTPFLELGIPAIDIIDFDYPYWHTTADTYDKISADSLQAVGDTLLHWLLSQ